MKEEELLQAIEHLKKQNELLQSSFDFLSTIDAANRSKLAASIHIEARMARIEENSEKALNAFGMIFAKADQLMEEIRTFNQYKIKEIEQAYIKRYKRRNKSKKL